MLSDEEDWHIVLNNWYLVRNNISDEDFEQEYEWFRALPESEQKIVKQKSWERIFHVFKEDGSSVKYIQATFWELRLEYVKSVRFFKGRLREKSNGQKSVEYDQNKKKAVLIDYVSF